MLLHYKTELKIKEQNFTIYKDRKNIRIKNCKRTRKKKGKNRGVVKERKQQKVDYKKTTTFYCIKKQQEQNHQLQ